MRSIIKMEPKCAADRECYLCDYLWGIETKGTASMPLERHHIFDGPNRKKSEARGLVVYLCHLHHNEPPNGVHHNIQNMKLLKRIGQRAYEEQWGTREEFMKEFGENNL